MIDLKCNIGYSINVKNKFWGNNIEIKPNYYYEFKCIASDCRHNCCIGWKIDIDDETEINYKSEIERLRKENEMKDLQIQLLEKELRLKELQEQFKEKMMDIDEIGTSLMISNIEDTSFVSQLDLIELSKKQDQGNEMKYND